MKKVSSTDALVLRVKGVLALHYTRTPERGRGTGVYEDGWTDRRVAGEVQPGLPRTFVAEVRQHLMD